MCHYWRAVNESFRVLTCLAPRLLHSNLKTPFTKLQKWKMMTFCLIVSENKIVVGFPSFEWHFRTEASMRLHNLEFSKGFFVDFVMKGFRIFFGDHFTNWRVSFKILEFGWKCSESRSIFFFSKSNLQKNCLRIKTPKLEKNA